MKNIEKQLQTLGLKRNSRSWHDYERAKEALLPEDIWRIDYCLVIQAICDYLDL